MKKIILLSLLLALIGCTTAPLTGRPQLKLVSDETLAINSASAYNQFIGTYKNKGLVVNNSLDGKRLTKIGNNMSKAVEKYMIENKMGNKIKYLNWEFNLIKNDEINAFALPGGKIAFYTGIMPILKTDAGIAFVMGHEIGHVIAGHHAEGQSHQTIAGLGSLAIDVATGGGLVSEVANIGLVSGVLKGNRTQEYEADKYGMIFMAMAGYNPTEAIAAEKRMIGVGQGNNSDFFSTHPNGAKRVEELQKFLPEAMKYYKK